MKAKFIKPRYGVWWPQPMAVLRRCVVRILCRLPHRTTSTSTCRGGRQCCRPAHLASRDCRVFADLAPGILQSQAAAAQSIRLLVLKFWLSGRQEARTRQETAPALQIDNVLGAGSTAAAAACCRPTLTAAAQAGYLPLLHSLSLFLCALPTGLGGNVKSYL